MLERGSRHRSPEESRCAVVVVPIYVKGKAQVEYSTARHESMKVYRLRMARGRPEVVVVRCFLQLNMHMHMHKLLQSVDPDLT